MEPDSEEKAAQFDDSRLSANTNSSLITTRLPSTENDEIEGIYRAQGLTDSTELARGQHGNSYATLSEHGVSLFINDQEVVRDLPLTPDQTEEAVSALDNMVTLGVDPATILPKQTDQGIVLEYTDPTTGEQEEALRIPTFHLTEDESTALLQRKYNLMRAPSMIREMPKLGADQPLMGALDKNVLSHALLDGNREPILGKVYTAESVQNDIVAGLKDVFSDPEIGKPIHAALLSRIKEDPQAFKAVFEAIANDLTQKQEESDWAIRSSLAKGAASLSSPLITRIRKAIDPTASAFSMDELTQEQSQTRFLPTKETDDLTISRGYVDKETNTYGPHAKPELGNHRAIDIAGQSWSPIPALAPGTVTVSPTPKGKEGLGPTIATIQHPNQLESTYGHLYRFYVEDKLLNPEGLLNVGENIVVLAGEKIGANGSEGNSTGPHADISVNGPDGKRIPPIPNLVPNQFGYSLVSR